MKKTIAAGVWASPGPFPRNGDISATLDDDYATGTATLKVFSMTFEPITSETNALGRTVNPSCVVVGRPGHFKTTVYGSISDSDIKWSASSEAAGLQTQSGPEAEVVPTACGTNTLTIQVGDYERAKGLIKFIAVEETTTEIRAYILGTANGFPRTATEVTNHVATVNKIFAQAGMKFVLYSVTNIALTEAQLQIGADGGLTDADICNIARNTGGLEIYYVPEIERDSGKEILALSYGPEGRDLGIIAGTNATGMTVAHEIGHACGLLDIYESVRNMVNLDGRAFTWMDLYDDWGCTSPDISFYSRKDITAIIKNLLMKGSQRRVGTDIPFGPVFGIWYDWSNEDSDYQFTFLPVGVTPGFERNPRHE